MLVPAHPVVVPGQGKGPIERRILTRTRIQNPSKVLPVPPLTVTRLRNLPTSNGVSSSFGTSQIWSGYALVNTANPYAEVYGEWNVPTLSVAPIGTTSNQYASQWVGIDGYGTNDVIQDGTEHQSICFYNCILHAAFYYAWYEFWPDTEKRISGIDIEPADHIFANAYVTIDKNGAIKGNFIVCNQSRNQCAIEAEYAPTGVVATRTTAEWIVERPTINMQTPLLADYVQTSITEAIFSHSNGGYVPFNLSSNKENIVAQIAMTRNGGNSKLLSFAIDGGLEKISFLWTAFQ